jgi:hypothetical protein
VVYGRSDEIRGASTVLLGRFELVGRKCAFSERFKVAVN